MMEKEGTQRPILFYICVPVYKVELYLDECIQSVLNQTYSNWRLVLVDDGSPDRCGEICDGYAARDERITVIHQPNRGLLLARSTALTEVLRHCAAADQTDSYVVFVDSDDSLTPNALEVISGEIQKTQCDLLIYGATRVRDGKELGKVAGLKSNYEGVVTEKRELYRMVLCDSTYNSLCRKAVSTNIISDRSYEEFAKVSHGEDLLRSLEYYKKTRKTVFIADSLYHYRVNPKSITRNVTFENYEVDTTVREQVLNFLERENVWDEDLYQKFFRSCRNQLRSTVSTVAEFRTGMPQKKKVLERILQDPYYKTVLLARVPLDPTLYCLKKRRYRLTLLLARGSRLKYMLRQRLCRRK